MWVKRIERNHERQELKLIKKLNNQESIAEKTTKEVEGLEICPICKNEIIHL